MDNHNKKDFHGWIILKENYIILAKHDLFVKVMFGGMRLEKKLELKLIAKVRDFRGQF